MEESDKQHRLLVPVAPELLQRIDEYRWQHRLTSRAVAIRTLIEAGLTQEDPDAPRRDDSVPKPGRRRR